MTVYPMMKFTSFPVVMHIIILNVSSELLSTILRGVYTAEEDYIWLNTKWVYLVYLCHRQRVIKQIQWVATALSKSMVKLRGALNHLSMTFAKTTLLCTIFGWRIWRLLMTELHLWVQILERRLWMIHGSEGMRDSSRGGNQKWYLDKGHTHGY